MKRDRRDGVRTALGLAVLLALAAGLAACGSASSASPPSGSPTAASSASASPTASSVALARELGSLDSLLVLRRDAIPQNHISFGFPARVTVSDPGRVRAVARALLALPTLPKGVLHAPVDLGITYRLVFATARGRLPAIIIEATGLQAVRGLGSARWLALTPHFWVTLGSAMGLARPGYAAFRGSMPHA